MNKKFIYRPLHLPLALILLAAVVAYFMIEWVEQESAKTEVRYQSHLKEADKIYREVKELQEKVALINTYYGRFQTLEAQGVYEQQSRVAWIDHFMDMVADFGVINTTLNFTARDAFGQQDYQPLAPMYQLLQYETLDFSGAFQHEEDWLSFLHELQLKVNSLALLEQCHLMGNANLRSGLLNEAVPTNRFEPEKGNLNIGCILRLPVFNLPLKAVEESVK